MGDSQKYSTWLLEPQWQSKRIEILERDNHKCKYCSNRNILKDLHVGTLHRINDDIDSPGDFLVDEIKDGYRLYIDSFIISGTTHAALIFNYRKLEKSLSYLVFHQLTPNVIIAISKRKRDIRAIYQEYNLGNKCDPSNLGLFLDEKFLQSVQWDYVKGLHVHHKYYQEDKRPWEYSDDSMITVCSPCHETIHAREKIPFLDKKGRQTNMVTPCNRCGGKGYIHEYRHVQEGICFRCNGVRYEEFIQF